MRKPITRRDFLRLAGGTLAAATGVSLIPRIAGKNLLQPSWINSAGAQELPPDLVFAATDGWISVPTTPATPFHPDNLAPAPFTTYVFGFRNVTGQTPVQIQAQKMKAQHSAPLFWADENQTLRLRLTNLGLAMRPDLVDAHTLHWHGFRHVIPFFDGEPMGSVSVPIDRDFTYIFKPHEPGTYMYHCHVEDIEHVHMGMTGLVYVRPAQNGNTALYPSGKYAYNDGDGTTGFDREFAMLLTEVWAEAHWDDSHIQLPEWTEYRVDFALLNGRTYPDTLAPSGSIDPYNPVYDANGDLIPTPGYEHLQYQPISSLVQCNAGERVLLRFANLGFTQATMTTMGIKMHVVGRDATLLRGRTGADTSYLTNTVSVAAGESADAIFTAPAYRGPGPYDTYLLYNRSHSHVNNLSPTGYGGQMTEIRVFPAGTVAPQTLPNI
ncbi:MAG: multicopper oxidase domain-containing protein [Caldilineaceae bacterium]|nr:multicopper oxidase domain-containing protein [Caldilineaceae bacterium]